MRLAPPTGEGVDTERERRRGWVLIAVGCALLFIPMLVIDRSPSMFGVLDLFLAPDSGMGLGSLLLVAGAQMVGLVITVLGLVRLVRYPAGPPLTELARLRQRVADLERENEALRRSSGPPS